MNRKQYEADNLPTQIVIGRQTETGVMSIYFDCTGWLTWWPNLTLSIWVTPPGGSSAYLATTHMEDKLLVWDVDNADTATAGQGTMEIVGTASGQRKLSAVTATKILASTTTKVTNPPEKGQSFLDQMAATTAKAEDATEAAKAAAAEADAAAAKAADITETATAAETDRVQAESIRAANEQNRVDAEGLRADAETGRAQAESDRATAETQRQSAEQDRAIAEQQRATAETARAEAETQRESAEAERRETFAGFEGEIGSLKDDLNDINQKQGQMPFSVIKNSYYKLDGTYENYGGWSRTPFLTLPNTKKLIFDNTDTSLSKYNCFYDENRKFISSFSIWKGYYNDSVDVPSNAKFVGFSGETRFINGLKVSFVETGENVVREKVGINTKLRVCSFNVGLWTDGESSNARVADEDVPKASVALRRFIGESNADFILCEEATHEFNKSMTIDAYTQCFENNLPYGWKTSESGNWAYVRQMLLASKYKIVNVEAHEYKCGSTRGYATFDASICGKYVTFIVCHLSTESNSDGLRQQEMEELKSVMNDYEYSILCGDFNAYSIDEFTNHFGDFNIANHGYFGDFTTWPVDGWESWNHCLDNIITTKNITIENVYMGNVDMSDHRPLIADLLIN